MKSGILFISNVMQFKKVVKTEGAPSCETPCGIFESKIYPYGICNKSIDSCGPVCKYYNKRK
jgi:hypothetical protein